MTDFIIDHANTLDVPYTPASNVIPAPTREELSIEINTLQREVERLTNSHDYYERLYREYSLKIENVRGLIQDYVSAGDRIEDQTKEICDLLDIELTKEISGTAVYEISWSATVPLDFDADSMEISFGVECESYEAEDFDWNEDNCEVNGSDD
jgi:hypothetical protein